MIIIFTISTITYYANTSFIKIVIITACDAPLSIIVIVTIKLNIDFLNSIKLNSFLMAYGIVRQIQQGKRWILLSYFGQSSTIVVINFIPGQIQFFKCWIVLNKISQCLTAFFANFIVRQIEYFKRGICFYPFGQCNTAIIANFVVRQV